MMRFFGAKNKIKKKKKEIGKKRFKLGAMIDVKPMERIYWDLYH
jgi:hypothetical protein